MDRISKISYTRAVKRQFAILSAGRTASTSLFRTLIETLQVRNAVFPIWDFSPADLLEKAYAGDRFDYVLVKSETFHVLRHLRFRDRTTAILLTRRDHLRQIVSHLVALHSGRFRVERRASPAKAEPVRIERNEFLCVAHMVLMMEQFMRTADLDGFDQVERWAYEDLVADFPFHLRKLGVDKPRIAQARGVAYDFSTVLNMDEVLGWAEALRGEGLRVPKQATLCA